MKIPRMPVLRTIPILVLATLLGCSDSSTGPDVTPASVSITGLPATMDALGTTLQIEAVVLNAAGSPLPSTSVQWSSSDASVATVSATGRITSVANGEATIRAEVPGGLQATGRVTVAQVPVTMERVQGDIQDGTVGTPLADPLRVRVLDGAGSPMQTGSVAFRVTAGQGLLTSATDVQLGAGEVAVRYTPTRGFGVHRIEASMGQVSTTFSVNVAPPPLRIVNESLPQGIVGRSYSIDLNATGGDGSTYRWSVTSGDLPPGLTLYGTLGQISGFANLIGAFTFDLTVTSGGIQATKTFTIEIFPRVSIVEDAFGPFLTNRTYSIQLEATGGLPQDQQWTATGLPPGFSLSESGVLTGSPYQVGPFRPQFRVASGGDSDTWFTDINVYDPLEFVTAPDLPNARRDWFYNQDIVVRGGNGRSYDNDLDLVAGSLPPGIILGLSGVYGIPTQTGTYRFTLRFTDNDQLWVERQFTLVVTF